MAEYTYADVIIDPDDPRVEIGAEYYAANSINGALKAANEGNEGLLAKLDSVNREPTRTLITSESFTISYKHGNGGKTDFLIRKKEPKYVPFDLSDPEVRKSLRGRWIKADSGEYQISGFRSIDGVDGEEWEVAVSFGVIPSETLFNRWTFEDGTPCGKLVEKDDKWKEIAE